jgi:acetyltransferase-like isoleucine patch superfamily enzyme
MSNNHRTVGNVLRGIYNRICLGLARCIFPAQLRLPFYLAIGMKIGRRTKIAATVDIDHSAPEYITIGNDVWVTRGVMILCHQRDLVYYEKDKPVMDCPLIYKPVVIKDGAHIGIGSIIMPGVTIGKGTVIGAGSVVTHDIPDYSVAVGVPAKVIKSLVK